jgi:hypothetical protein
MTAKIMGFSSLAILMLCLLQSAIGAEIVEVKLTLASGRAFVGVVDAASNAETIWLRSGSGQALIRRPIAADKISSIEIAGKAGTVADLRELALNDAGEMKSPSDLVRQVTKGKIVVQNPLPKPTPSAGENSQGISTLPPVTLRLNAATANWNADASQDGLLVSIFPLDREGNVVPVNGTVEIEWWGSQAVSRTTTPVGRESVRPVRWGYWSEQLTPANSQAGHRLQLPFQHFHPQHQPLLFPYSLVRVRLIVPGVGNLTADLDGVRALPWQPLVDFSRR